METTDKSLIDAHCRGETEAFTELVRRYGAAILGYLMKMSKNQEQAEDFFQETFKRVHEKAYAFRGGQFKSLLFKIATNVALDGFRKERSVRVVRLNQNIDCSNENSEEFSVAAAVDNSSNPLEEAIRAEHKKKVREAINLLPAKQRATLVLAYYQQLTYRQVAQTLGCSVGTVKTQMFRALRMLAGKLPDISGENE